MRPRSSSPREQRSGPRGEHASEPGRPGSGPSGCVQPGSGPSGSGASRSAQPGVAALDYRAGSAGPGGRAAGANRRHFRPEPRWRRRGRGLLGRRRGGGGSGGGTRRSEARGAAGAGKRRPGRVASGTAAGSAPGLSFLPARSEAAGATRRRPGRAGPGGPAGAPLPRFLCPPPAGAPERGAARRQPGGGPGSVRPATSTSARPWGPAPGSSRVRFVAVGLPRAPRGGRVWAAGRRRRAGGCDPSGTPGARGSQGRSNFKSSCFSFLCCSRTCLSHLRSEFLCLASLCFLNPQSVV